MSEGELDVLDPPRREMTIRGERLEFQPLVLAQLPEMGRLIEPVAQSVAGLIALPEGEQLLEITAELLQRHGDRLPRAVALAVRRDLKWVALAQLDEFTAMAVAALSLNQDFFLQGFNDLPRPAGRRGPVTEPWTLADSIQLLLDRGHARTEVLGYTLAQFRAHLTAATRARKRDLRDAAVSMRAAQLYDKPGFAAYLKDLGNG